jgi:hypothetical protein
MKIPADVKRLIIQKKKSGNWGKKDQDLLERVAEISARAERLKARRKRLEKLKARLSTKTKPVM